MRINLKGTGLDLTPALTSYTQEKIDLLDKLLTKYDDVFASVEIGKETKHHKTGQWFFAEINLKLPKKTLRNVVEDIDLYAAIDRAKDGMAEEIRSYEKRQQSLFRRGARVIKNTFLRRAD